jgi:hypothetical protein
MDSSDVKKNKKKKYSKPKVKSEKVMTFGALCNGSSTAGGRKAAAGAPNFCVASKTLS